MKAKVLTTSSEICKGVLGRDNLEPDEVYIFINIFPSQGFHMRGVDFPLDIAFLDKNCSIINVQNMESQDGSAFAPEGTCYAVEACKDYFINNNLKAGALWKEIFNIISQKSY